jgi:hypothetical protein
MSLGKLVGGAIGVMVAVAVAVVFLWVAPSGNAAAPEAPVASGVAVDETSEWTLERVLALSRDEIIALWKAAPAADMAELNGHYMGLVPNAGDPERRAATDARMYDENSDIGFWLGKAYQPTTATTGEGYNRWRYPGGKVVRNMQFATEMGTSLIDGKPSLLMYYGAYNDESTLIDEIRKLDDYVYLGVGTTEREDGGRSEPGHFMLLGPTDEWVGPDEPAERVDR